jgi:hypothetical protein
MSFRTGSEPHFAEDVVIPYIGTLYSQMTATSGLIQFTPVPRQESSVGDAVSIQPFVLSYVSPLVYSGVGLPAGVHIDPSTGLLSGVIAAGADASSPYVTIITATAMPHTASTSFVWVVAP